MEERYQGYDDYVRRFGEYTDKLVKERYLLREDADRLLKEREGQRKLFEEGKR